jgi:hypothetical protein
VSLEGRRDFERFAVVVVMVAVLSNSLCLILHGCDNQGARAFVQGDSKQPRVPRFILPGAPIIQGLESIDSSPFCFFCVRFA